ncbi:pentapeptide repeat-containing protein [Pseudoclavibacter sp. RFBB5]|uniref:pentapeptide repeat-containing protein n=1 Tax=Pseudoclavibacter sp. RFBB5 TaxID=2080574 RepID=UPI0015E1CEDD|nr:pentapeptide repeat-containing protein [Pseudoclavibacter sp. RFBB5]
MASTLDGMSAADSKTLRDRWTSSELSSLRTQLARLSGVVPGPHRITPSWHDPASSVTDLRGLQAGSLGVSITHLEVSEVDASGFTGGLTIRDSTLTHVRFEHAKVAAHARLEGALRACTFTGANIPQASIGPEVSNCSFADSKLRRLRAVPGTVFSNCSFDGAELSGAEFTNTRFIDCSFTGAKFNAATTFRGCTFVGASPKFGKASETGTKIEPLAG